MLKNIINQKYITKLISSKILLKNIKCNSNSMVELNRIIDHELKKKSKEKKKALKNIIIENITKEQLEATKLLLMKYNVDTTELTIDSKLFSIQPNVIEQRIMLLQEFEVSKITEKLISNFENQLDMPIISFKNLALIDSKIKLSESLLASVNVKFIDTSESDSMKIKQAYMLALYYYLKHNLNLTSDAIHKFHYKKIRSFYNSFRLIHKLLNILLNELKFDNTIITKNKCLLGCHPSNIKDIINILQHNFKESFYEVIRKYPRILIFDPHDLQNYMILLTKYNISLKTILKYPEIFKFNSIEFKIRLEYLLNNPLTFVFKEDPSFLRLIICFKKVYPRLRCLHDNNVKYVNISALTKRRTNVKELCAIKKIKSTTLICFLKMNFRDNIEKLFEDIKKHPYYEYVPLVQMYQTLQFLRQHFPEEIIYRHVYSILYPLLDVQISLETLRSKHKNMPLSQLLALCIYSIERKYNFTGECVINQKIQNKHECRYE